MFLENRIKLESALKTVNSMLAACQYSEELPFAVWTQQRRALKKTRDELQAKLAALPEKPEQKTLPLAESKFDAKKFWTDLRARITERGLSQTEFSRRAGLSHSYLGDAARIGCVPKNTTLAKIEAALAGVESERKRTTTPFGEKLRYLRRQRGWSQSELGQLIGVRQEFISRYEVGERLPCEDNVSKLAWALDVPENELARYLPPKSPSPTTLGKSIRTRLKRRGWTAAHLARKAGLSASAVTGLIRGEGTPRPLTLEKIACALGISYKELEALI